MPKFVCLISSITILIPLAYAQDSSVTQSQNGFHLYSLGIASSYSSLSFPQSQFADAASNIGPAALGYKGDLATTYSGSLGWRRTRSSSAVSILYSPNYTTYRNSPEWNSFTHALLIDAGRPLRLSSRATLRFTIATNIDDFRQYTVTPASAGSLLTGFDRATSPGSGPDSTLLTGTPVSSGLTVLDSPARLLIYGNRMLTASARTSLEYDVSQRFKVSTTLGASRTQRLSGSTGDPTSRTRLASQATNASGSIEMSYSLSRNTDIGAELNTNRSFSSFEDAYGTAVNAFYSRRIHRSWFVRVNGGTGFYIPVTRMKLYEPPSGAQIIAGSVLGYKARGSSYELALQRTMSNSYAVGGNSNLISIAANKSLRPKGWLVGSSLLWQRFDGSQYQSIRSWQGATSVTRVLSSELQLQLQYSYSTYRGIFGGDSYKLAQSGIRVGLRWSPRYSIL